MNLSMLALLVLFPFCSSCETTCYCDPEYETAHCTGYEPKLDDTSCEFEPRMIYSVPCDFVTPTYTPTAAAAYLTESETETETSTTTTQASSATVLITTPTNAATKRTKRTTKRTTTTTTTTSTTTTYLLTTTPPPRIRHATTTLPSLTLAKPKPTKPIRLPTSTTTLPPPQTDGDDELPSLSEPDPITFTPPPPPNDEPLQQPPNVASSHQRADPPNSDSGHYSDFRLEDVLGPVGGVVGGSALGAGVYFLRRRRRRLQQQQAAANASQQPLHPNDNRNRQRSRLGLHSTSDDGDTIIDDGAANGGANGPANARGGGANGPAATADARGGGANGPASPTHGSAAGSPTQPTATATDNALNLSLNRDHTAAALALNDCHSPEMQRHTLAYRTWLFDRGLDPDLVIQGSDQSRELIRQWRVEYVNQARARDAEDEEAWRRVTAHAEVLLNPEHRVAIPLQPLPADAAANQSHESIDETTANEDHARNLTDHSFHSNDAEDDDGGEEDEEGTEDGTAQANNNEEVVAVVGANGRPRRSDRARKSPDRLGIGKNAGSKYNRKIVAKNNP